MANWILILNLNTYGYVKMKLFLFALFSFASLGGLGHGSTQITELSDSPSPSSKPGFLGLNNDDLAAHIISLLPPKDRSALRLTTRGAKKAIDQFYHWNPLTLKLRDTPQDVETILKLGGDGKGGIRNTVTINTSLTHFLGLSSDDQERLLSHIKFTGVTLDLWSQLTQDQIARFSPHVIGYGRSREDFMSPVQILEFFPHLTSLGLQKNFLGVAGTQALME
jgi:hypothetical protein